MEEGIGILFYKIEAIYTAEYSYPYFFNETIFDFCTIIQSLE
jgi:hypothetical protein